MLWEPLRYAFVQLSHVPDVSAWSSAGGTDRPAPLDEGLVGPACRIRPWCPPATYAPLSDVEIPDRREVWSDGCPAYVDALGERME